MAEWRPLHDSTLHLFDVAWCTILIPGAMRFAFLSRNQGGETIRQIQEESGCAKIELDRSINYGPNPTHKEFVLSGVQYIPQLKHLGWRGYFSGG